ncbi:CD83 antigen-like isoform X3 [Carettochelys insculpta]|uniref:CD83 antigen-like isoform X3 n=1 Tax=Carettochelys insculpta TaxID=44489 RepID=UPI003EB740F9
MTSLCFHCIHLRRKAPAHEHFSLCHLWFVLQRTAVAAESVRVQCGETATLPCPTAPGEMHNYWAIGWYKVANESQEMGLIRRHENNTRVYSGIQREFLMDVQQSLVIPEVQPEDSGAYRCSLWARVGHFNQQADIILQVSGDCRRSEKREKEQSGRKLLRKKGEDDGKRQIWFFDRKLRTYLQELGVAAFAT